mmetsp:Transcript_26140/g.68771  ORF Transcript_26140/g.68771 Transcript_26140/m.68771 type:complete len:91 (-) Transcript_26140:12-284(-)
MQQLTPTEVAPLSNDCGPLPASGTWTEHCRLHQSINLHVLLCLATNATLVDDFVCQRTHTERQVEDDGNMTCVATVEITWCRRQLLVTKI